MGNRGRVSGDGGLYRAQRDRERLDAERGAALADFWNTAAKHQGRSGKQVELGVHGGHREPHIEQEPGVTRVAGREIEHPPAAPDQRQKAPYLGGGRGSVFIHR